jgi:hypothetical protein
LKATLVALIIADEASIAPARRDTRLRAFRTRHGTSIQAPIVPADHGRRAPEQRAPKGPWKGMNDMSTWLETLQTATPEQGFELALKLSRMGVKYTQPSDEIRKTLRPVYEKDADALIAASQVVAINFQTIAAANAYWR